MKYLYRHFEKVVKYALKQTKVVLVTGARQVGKTSLIMECFGDFNYVTLDDDNELILANDDKLQFFNNHKIPLAIDEVQYAQGLFKNIKLIVDKDSKKGQVILIGSQSFLLMDKVSDSLAGRISILEMPTFSLREIKHDEFYEKFLPNERYFKLREKSFSKCNDIWKIIQRGTFPELLDENRNSEWFYRDYINTYIERDIKKISTIKDEILFKKFLISIAARTGQLLVYEDIADDIGVAVNTIRNWISIVLQTGLIKLVNTYQNNLLKRVIKTPKLYFMDTGIVCYLLGWKSSEQCQNGAMSGALFETFVFSEICKSILNSGNVLDNIYYYRDKEKNEIDLLIEDGNDIYPIEIKKAATVNNSWDIYKTIAKKINGKNIKNLTIICQVDKYIKFSENAIAIPFEYI